MSDITAADKEWVETQDALVNDGRDIVKDASDEALDYVSDALENFDDRQWRKMAVQSQALEMGVGVAFAEHAVARVYQDMEKKLGKRLKISKELSRSIRHIYIGRVMKNIRKALNERAEQGN